MTIQFEKAIELRKFLVTPVEGACLFADNVKVRIHTVFFCNLNLKNIEINLF